VGYCPEQGLSDIGIEPPVYGGCAEEISKPVPVAPLQRRIPPHGRRTEQAARIDARSPPLIGRAHLALVGRMTPVGVAGRELFVEVSRLGVPLRLTMPAHDDVAEQGHPTMGMEHR